MSVVEHERTEILLDQEPPEKMWHIIDEVRGDTWALCGTRLRNKAIDDGPVDCVVCDALWNAL